MENVIEVTAEAKEIKKELKAAGYKKLSVRSENAGCSDAIFVYILDDSDLKKANEICKKHESYERDARTGEILCGGNRFIFVQRG